MKTTVWPKAAILIANLYFIYASKSWIALLCTFIIAFSLILITFLEDEKL